MERGLRLNQWASALCAHVLVYHLTMPLSPLALEVVTRLVILPVTLPNASYPAQSHKDASSKGN